MHKTTILALTLAAAGAFAAPAAQAQVAKVNGVTIPQARADFLLREAIAQGRPDSPELRAAVKQRLIESELIAQEAARMGLDKKTPVAAQLDLARQQVLVGAYINEMTGRIKPDEESLKAAHERLKEHPAASEYRVSHILVGNEKTARDLIAQIKNGGSFEKLAAENSRDDGSKNQGGDLGWSAMGKFVRPFAEAMVKLKKSELTEQPVQSQFGWHVIRMNDVRPLGYEALKPQLQQLVQRETLQKTIADLRAKAKVE
ncbi:MAG: peptidylprolyl isomerase [Burkholderiales bacterium]